MIIQEGRETESEMFCCVEALWYSLSTLDSDRILCHASCDNLLLESTSATITTRLPAIRSVLGVSPVMDREVGTRQDLLRDWLNVRWSILVKFRPGCAL